MVKLWGVAGKFKRILAGVVLAGTSVIAQADEAVQVSQAPLIDGVPNDQAWTQTQGPWYEMDQVLLGEVPDKQDFSARYTLRWDEQHLYLWVQIQDDVLYDAHPNPLEKYWDDDCLEIFIDEDASGGDHLYNHNAYAYHLALDNQAVDIGEGQAGKPGVPELFNHHIDSAWQRDSQAPYTLNWEVAIKVYSDSGQGPMALNKGKKMGFMLAYCDNDGSAEREHFVGSHPIAPRNGDRNLGYKDASVFDSLLLVEGEGKP